MQSHSNISAELTTEQETAALAAIAEIENQLPFLVEMAPEERRRIAKAGNRSQAFVQQALDLARDSPDILPRDFELAEFEKDIALAERLGRLAMGLTRVQERLRNTIMAAQADAYQQALEVYHRSKRSRRDGLGDLTRQLGRRFRRASTPDTPANGTN